MFRAVVTADRRRCFHLIVTEQIVVLVPTNEIESIAVVSSSLLAAAANKHKFN